MGEKRVEKWDGEEEIYLPRLYTSVLLEFLIRKMY